MPLTRVASGLLFRDDFDRPDGPLGDQYTISGTAGTWAIVGGRAQFTSDRGERMARINIPARQEIYAQVRWAKPGVLGLGLLCRWDGTTAGGGYLLPHLGGSVDDAFALYRRVGSNSYTLIANGSSSMAGATPELGHAHIRDSVQRGWRNGVLLLERADAALDGTDGYLALRGASGSTQAGHVGLVEQVVVCTNPRIVCRGLK